MKQRRERKEKREEGRREGREEGWKGGGREGGKEGERKCGSTDLVCQLIFHGGKFFILLYKISLGRDCTQDMRQ